MTSPEMQGGTNPKKDNLTCLTQTQLAGLAAAAALIGGAVAYFALTALAPDPDRPPIIVRNGSLIVAEIDNDVRGELKKDPSRRTWYHEHQHRGPRWVNAFVVGVDNSTCGSGGTHTVWHFRKATIDYSMGDASGQVEILIRGSRIEIDVLSGPDPTNVNAWTLSFGGEGARLRRVMFEAPGGNSSCDLGAGASVLITQR